MENRKLALVADFYEFTMSNGYFENHMQNTIAYFDMFFRKIPDNGGYVITAGLQQVIDYILNLSFTKEDINFLRNKNMFSESFLKYLENFKFTGDIWAIPEGTVVFPYEPLITVKAPIIEAQLIETMLLLLVNHQSLIATKTNRIVQQAKGLPVMEFGARRAHNVDAAILGARAAIIGGAVGTSCTYAAKEYNVPASGTMAHSWVQSFRSEYDAFKSYAELYPDNCILLVDTFNTLTSGIPNAIKVFDEILTPKGYRPQAIRLDSGDLAYLSKIARHMLDDAGYSDCKICATNSLDEYLITSLLEQGAKVDLFGVGENLITAKSEPVFGGVYKLVAIENKGTILPKIKLSENTSKITNPGFKKIYRFYDKHSSKALGDVITLEDETISEDSYTLFNPYEPWKTKMLTNYTIRPLQEKIFENGKLVYQSPTVGEIALTVKKEVSTLWEEITRIQNPHIYYVDLSKKLWELKNKMLASN